MWNAHNQNDILDFALLWEPLGGPTPENVVSAFSIDLTEYNHRLQSAVRRQLSQLQHDITSPEVIYALSAVAPLLKISPECHGACPDLPAVSQT